VKVGLWVSKLSRQLKHKKCLTNVSQQRQQLPKSNKMQCMLSNYCVATFTSICSIVAIDEMDILVTKKQSVLYNFFEWPTRSNVPLVVIGISNTLNLPEQMMARINSRLGRAAS
jgi:Cdc6-like AAA superfamily ATPase